MSLLESNAAEKRRMEESYAGEIAGIKKRHATDIENIIKDEKATVSVYSQNRNKIRTLTK
jgi:hypothetical protein